MGRKWRGRAVIVKVVTKGTFGEQACHAGPERQLADKPLAFMQGRNYLAPVR